MATSVWHAELSYHHHHCRTRHRSLGEAMTSIALRVLLKRTREKTFKGSRKSPIIQSTGRGIVVPFPRCLVGEKPDLRHDPRTTYPSEETDCPGISGQGWQKMGSRLMTRNSDVTPLR